MGQYSSWFFWPMRLVARAGIVRRIILRGRDRLASSGCIDVDVEASTAQDWLVFRYGFGSAQESAEMVGEPFAAIAMLSDRPCYQRSPPTPTLTPGARMPTPARGPSSQSR